MLIQVNDDVVIETDGIKAIWSQRDQQNMVILNSCVVSYGIMQIGIASHSPAALRELIHGSQNLAKLKMN